MPDEASGKLAGMALSPQKCCDTSWLHLPDPFTPTGWNSLLPRKLTNLLLTTLAAATIAAVNAPTASAATYTPLKTASQGPLITRPLINDQTREFHAEGRNLRSGDHVGHPSITATANPAEPSLLPRRSGRATPSSALAPGTRPTVPGSSAWTTTFTGADHDRFPGTYIRPVNDPTPRKDPPATGTHTSRADLLMQNSEGD